MAVFLSWVDYSAADRERMRQAFQLFQEQTTRDELGLGTIRDAFADCFFPGTSTIQTRLRYFLIVPWVYRSLERSSVSAKTVASRARKAELELINPLMEADDNRGAMGRVAGDTLKRLPSSVYWAGLRRWQVFKLGLSTEEYHRDFDVLRRMNQAPAEADDEGTQAGRLHTWHAQLPDPPAGFPEQLDFSLTKDEASFLQGRIVDTCPGSALAWLAVNGHPADATYLWQHPDLGSFPTDLWARVNLARRFSNVVHGAALLYNLMLAQRAKNEKLVADYETLLIEWEAGPEAEDLRGFRVDDLWAFTGAENVEIPRPTQAFVTQWSTTLANASEVATHSTLRTLVQRREEAIKGARSRFRNARALNGWGGYSGTARFDYRWRTARDHLNDLYAGLSRTADEALVEAV